MAAACSTTSRPRNTSPSASGRVLPCSAVRMWASSLMFSRSSCWDLRKRRARVPIGVSRQVLKASLAAATAAFTSPVVANGPWASTSWVAGLITSCQWEVADSTNWPSISMRIRGAATVMTTIPRGAKDAWHYSQHPPRFPG
ncbi:hypothetical protein G6F68_011558 [Rhizopus microsporus]|nr:hypothetical protein G6F68_011558 [Rhizopus microsporus]